MPTPPAPPVATTGAVPSKSCDDWIRAHIDDSFDGVGRPLSLSSVRRVVEAAWEAALSSAAPAPKASEGAYPDEAARLAEKVEAECIRLGYDVVAAHQCAEAWADGFRKGALAQPSARAEGAKYVSDIDIGGLIWQAEHHGLSVEWVRKWLDDCLGLSGSAEGK